MKRIFKALCLVVFTSFFFSAQAAEKLDYASLRTLPILDQGRIKPFDTFARESVQTVTGRVFFEGKDPVETLLGWMAEPEKAIHAPLLLARYEPLNQKTGIVTQNGRISPDDLLNVKEFKLYLKGVMLKQQEGESLDPIQKEAAQLFQRMNLFYQIMSGEALTIFPEGKSEGWASSETAVDSKATQDFKKLLEAFKARDVSAFSAASVSLKQTLRDTAGSVSNYPTEGQMKREVCFNQIRPFQKAWILFLAAFVMALLALTAKKKFFYAAGLVFAVSGVGISIYGFVIRCLIAGRPPVSNMYESVIWVSFGAMIFALIFEAIYRSRYFLLSGAAGATLGLVLADNLPNVLSANINPLVPVLRSNYWLTIHVLTITLSYAAFLLAMGIGQVAIGYYAFRPQETSTIKRLNLFLYRVLQVGVVLLAAGTILGGVWANYSWGRFWGWDPKEVWALIALLGYLAILHGRFAGWLRDFGMAVWSVLSFLLVIMAWYGVNFVLGVGLHSYGFSSGGFTGVMIFVGTQLAWVLFATYRYKGLPKASAS
ncbi:MAG: cytochrome c biogenesis protein CcsA [bacterium]